MTSRAPTTTRKSSTTRSGPRPRSSGRRRRPPATPGPPSARRRCLGEQAARDQRLAQPERRGPGHQARWHEREQSGQVAHVGHRVHPHQQQVVALGDHVLVDLVRSLRRHEDVQTVLASLGRDLDGSVRGDPAEWVVGVGGADVVRLVDDDQHGLSVAPRGPQRAQHGVGDQALLLERLQGPEVHDRATAGRAPPAPGAARGPAGPRRTSRGRPGWRPACPGAGRSGRTSRSAGRSR